MDAGGKRQQRGVGMRTRKTCLQIQSNPPSGSKIKASLNRNPESLLEQMQVSGWGGWHRQHSARAINHCCMVLIMARMLIFSWAESTSSFCF